MYKYRLKHSKRVNFQRKVCLTVFFVGKRGGGTHIPKLVSSLMFPDKRIEEQLGRICLGGLDPLDPSPSEFYGASTTCCHYQYFLLSFIYPSYSITHLPTSPVLVFGIPIFADRIYSLLGLTALRHLTNDSLSSIYPSGVGFLSPSVSPSYIPFLTFKFVFYNNSQRSGHPLNSKKFLYIIFPLKF